MGSGRQLTKSWVPPPPTHPPHPQCRHFWLLHWPQDRFSLIPISYPTPRPPTHSPSCFQSGCSKMQIWSCHSLVSNPSAAPHLQWKESQVFIRDWMRDLLRCTLLSSILSHQSHDQPNPQWAGETIRAVRTSIAGMLQERTLHLNTKIFKGGWGFKEFFKCINRVNKTGEK